MEEVKLSVWKYISKKNDELYHYGVLGMKWGVRKARELAGVTYKATKKHGYKVMDQQAARMQYRSQYHASRGHKIRAKYYDRKAYKIKDSSFSDSAVMKTSVNDLYTKGTTIYASARIGASVVKKLMNK